MAHFALRRPKTGDRAEHGPKCSEHPPTPLEEMRHRVIGPRRRPMLLNDVLVVIKLLHRYYDDPAARQMLSAVWQPEARRRRRTHPVAVAGQIVRVDRKPEGEKEAIVLALKYQPQGSTERLVTRADRSLRLFDGLAEGDAVVVLASWDRFPKGPDADRSRSSYCTAWLTSPSQICKLDDAGIIDESDDGLPRVDSH